MVGDDQAIQTLTERQRRGWQKSKQTNQGHLQRAQIMAIWWNYKLSSARILITRCLESKEIRFDLF